MIVVFGSINLDLIFPVPRLPSTGETVLGGQMRTEPGGKGANQAVAAARDGATVAMVGAVGRDAFAGVATALLGRSGVDLSHVTSFDGATGCAAICTDDDGRNQIAVAPGANARVLASQLDESLLRPGTTLLLQMEVPATETATAIRRARARRCRIVLNLAPASPLDEEALRLVDVLVANDEEARWLADYLGVPPGSGDLASALGCDVVVTRGADGLEAVVSGSPLRIAVHPIPRAVDTTAAGDCLTGVMAAGLDRGLGLEIALRRANVAAALACTRAGSQGSLPTAAETDAALAARRRAAMGA